MPEIGNSEQFKPFSQSEMAVRMEPGKEFQSFMEERVRLLREEKEKHMGADVPMGKFVEAFAREEELRRICDENPRLRFRVMQARWTNNFVSMAERGNYYMKKTLEQFLFSKEIRQKIHLGLEYHGVAGEVMARQVLLRAGIQVAHARPELDAACGVDLLGYKKMPSGQDLYLAIQVKTDPYHQEVRFENLNKSDTLQTLKRKAGLSPDEDEMLKSGEKIVEATGHMKRVSGKAYEPFLLVMPSIRLVNDMHAVNLGTFKLAPELVDKFTQNVLKQV